VSYTEFLSAKAQLEGNHGFAPLFLPEYLFDFQAALIEWATLKGRAAIFADCGLGKTIMELVWSENVRRKTGGSVLLLTPLAVTHQIAAEAAKFGIAAQVSRDGQVKPGVTITNYERLHLFRSSDYAGERMPPSDILPYRGWKGKQTENRFSHWIWRQYADCMWDDIRFTRVLPYQEARDSEDEKHVHPLQLDVIDRCVVLRSNPGETVFTPFMGVGSEVYSPVILGRRGIGAELKPSYYRQAVKNVEAAARGHQFDVKTGDLFDEFAA
jgi:hypothetical protein